MSGILGDESLKENVQDRAKLFHANYFVKIGNCAYTFLQIFITRNSTLIAMIKFIC